MLGTVTAWVTTYNSALSTGLSALAPTLPLLIPGVGAQGGDAEATVRAGWRGSAGRTTAPIIVNSSRAVLYASRSNEFAEAARAVALATRDQLNAARR